MYSFLTSELEAEAKSLGVDPLEVRQALDRETRKNVPFVAPFLSFVFAVFTVAHFFFLRGAPRNIMIGVASVSTLYFLGVWLRTRGRLPEGRLASWLMVSFFAVAGVNSLLHLWLLFDPLQTTNLLLLILGSVYLILDGRWFFANLAFLVGGWIVIAASSPPAQEWGHFAMAMFSVSLMAIVVHRLHYRQLVRLEGLHLRDLQRQESLREAVVAAEASSRSKSRFLAHMSHELRTPLNSILGFTNLLGKNKSGSFRERELDFLARISGNGQHLLGLIDQVLDLSRVEADRLELASSPQDLGALIEEALALLGPSADEKGLSLVAKLPSEPCVVTLDPGRFRQILINLLDNAIKFSPSGRVQVSLETADSGARPTFLRVQDLGIGIPEDRLESIFEAFEQVDQGADRRFEGTGLGLAITRRLCEKMQIPIAVESTVGEGTTFILDLRRLSPD